MRRSVSIAVVVLLVAALASLCVAAGSRGKMELKAGDEIYACACGEACACLTMSNNAGKCTCGKDMVKAKVSSIEDGKAMLKAEAWDKPRPFKLAAQYACACPPECTCNTQSQNPGKCTCGKDMKKVEM